MRLKKEIYKAIMVFIGCCLFSIYAMGQADSLNANRYITRATMYGAGFTNVYDTYLSPQEYKGVEFRISRETIDRKSVV